MTTIGAWGERKAMFLIGVNAWDVGQTSIIGPAFLATTIVATAAMLVATVAVRRRPRRFLRWSGALLTSLCLLVVVALAVNSYFAYLPNVASLWGWRAADQTSWSTARRTAVGAEPGSSVKLPVHGAVVQVTIPGTRSGFHARPAEVYLPPAWFLSRKPRLPVIEMLHGTPGTPEDWTRSSGADRISDAWAAAHHGFAPILVMPDINGSFTRDSECTNGTAGAVETYLTVDVPNWVLTHLNPALSRERWAVGGVSEGGTCAVDLALRHPSRWATFLDFGGEDHISRSGGAQTLFTGPKGRRLRLIQSYDPIRLLHSFSDPTRTQAWFEAGANDGSTAKQVRNLAVVARASGMHVFLAIRVGGRHNWKVWRACFRDALPWAAQRLGAGDGQIQFGHDPRTRLVDLSRSSGPATDS